VVNVEVTEYAKKKAKKYQILKQLDKQVKFLAENPRHPSLKLQPLVESNKEIWKFRITKNYWGLVEKIYCNLRVHDVIKHLK